MRRADEGLGHRDQGARTAEDHGLRVGQEPRATQDQLGRGLDAGGVETVPVAVQEEGRERL